MNQLNDLLSNWLFDLKLISILNKLVEGFNDFPIKTKILLLNESLFSSERIIWMNDSVVHKYRQYLMNKYSIQILVYKKN